MQFSQSKPALNQNNNEAIISILRAYLAEKHDDDYAYPRPEIIQFFKKIHLFQSTSHSDRFEIKDIGIEETIMNILKFAKLEEFPSGHILYERGQESEKFYILIIGSVYIYKQKTLQEISLEFRNKKNIDYITLQTPEITNESYSLSPMPFPNNTNINTNDNIKKNDKLRIRPQTSFLPEKPQYDDSPSGSGMLQSELSAKNCKRSLNRFLTGNAKTNLKLIAAISPINIFGAEMIHIGQQIRENMAVAATPLKVLTIDNNGYKKVLFERDLSMKKRKNFFAEYFKDLSVNIIEKISQYMEFFYLKQGKCIYNEGDLIDGLYFLEEGKVKLVKKTATKHNNNPIYQKDKHDFLVERIVDEISHGHLFGEELLFPNIKERRYTSIVVFPRTCVYKLEKKYYDIMCKDHENVIKKLKESCLSKIQWREKRMESMIDNSKEKILKLNDITSKLLLRPRISINTQKLLSPPPTTSTTIKSTKLKEKSIARHIYRDYTTCDFLNSARIMIKTPENHDNLYNDNLICSQEDILKPKKLCLNKMFFKFNPTPADLSSMPASSRSQFTTRNNLLIGTSKERKRELLQKMAETAYRRNRVQTANKKWIRDSFLDKIGHISPIAIYRNISPKTMGCKRANNKKIVFVNRRSSVTPKKTSSPLAPACSLRNDLDSYDKEKAMIMNEKETSIEFSKNIMTTNENYKKTEDQIGKLEDISQKLNDLSSLINSSLKTYKPMTTQRN